MWKHTLTGRESRLCVALAIRHIVLFLSGITGGNFVAYLTHDSHPFPADGGISPPGGWPAACKIDSAGTDGNPVPRPKYSDGSTVNPGYNKPFYTLANDLLYPGIRCTRRAFT